MTVWRPDPELWVPRYDASGRRGLRMRCAAPSNSDTPGGAALWDLRMREEVAANRARHGRRVNSQVWEPREGGPGQGRAQRSGAARTSRPAPLSDSPPPLQR